VSSRDTGEILEWEDVKYMCGGTPKQRREYDSVRRSIVEAQRAAAEEWKRAVQAGTGMVPDEATSGEGKWCGGDQWEYKALKAARKAPKAVGGWEYLVAWTGTTEMTWENELELMRTGGVKQRERLQRVRATRRVPASLYERLHTRAAVQDDEEGWQRRQKVAAACKEKCPKDDDMRNMVTELYKQAGDVYKSSEWSVKEVGASGHKSGSGAAGTRF